MTKSSESYKSYWDRNIDSWSDLYLDISHGHETYDRPAWFTRAYHSTIGKHERRLMAQRYALTLDFIDKYVTPGSVLSDLGCGTGIFTVEALRRGASVNAIDFSDSSLRTTQRTVEKHIPEGKVVYQQANVQTDALPNSDVTLAMGLAPYLSDIGAFLDRALPATKTMLCLYMDPNHWANRIRSTIPFLNVRELQFAEKSEVDRHYARLGFNLIQRQPFATGYVDLVKLRTAS
jgi:SAM-dependent methyltransferase